LQSATRLKIVVFAGSIPTLATSRLRRIAWRRHRSLTC
jgi:hypothetical protein